MYHELGLLKKWFPEMLPMVDHEQNVYHSHDVWGHSLLAVEASKPELVHRLFALWHDIGKPECAEFKHKDYGYTFHAHTAASARIMRGLAERLKFGSREPVHMDLLYHLIEHHMDAFIHGKMSKMAKRIGLYDFAAEYGAKQVLVLAWEVGRSDWFGRAPNMDVKDMRGADVKLKAAFDKVMGYIEGVENPVFSTRDLAVNGHDVMRVTGIEPGPQVGQVIKQLFIHVQNGILPNEKEALEAAMLLGMPSFEGDE
jgi:tRNA nucleotidyltransferase/poly(A) polymerase